jgi:uncharacterized membrane protein YhdT
MSCLKVGYRGTYNPASKSYNNGKIKGLLSIAILFTLAGIHLPLVLSITVVSMVIIISGAVVLFKKLNF